MRRLAAIGAVLAGALLSGAPAASATPVRVARIEAEASRAKHELELLGGVSSPAGLPRGGSIAVLKLENHDGFEISVLAFGQTVALEVARPHDRRQRTAYLAHGTVTPSSIRASFAERGRIAVRLRGSGSGSNLPAPPGCAPSGHGAIGRSGVYVGELSFRGEGGYTSVDAHRVKGVSVDLDALDTCIADGNRDSRAALPPGLLDPAAARTSAPAPPGVPTHPSTGPKPTALIADAKAPLARTVFAALARGARSTTFLAAETSSEGQLGVVRYAFVHASRAMFAFDDSLSLAGVSPPAPFSGSASFQHGPGAARSWTGTLAVAFLGAPYVPLTGAPFATQLIRGW